ncbi:MAG: hypothetical protein JWR01_1944 [Subtercola sp.]|nr:hypothetical protein [Subtercola sp.]
MQQRQTTDADAGDQPPVQQNTQAPFDAPPRREYNRTVHHNGNRYFATAEMAEIFRSRAEQTAQNGETELIPLLHSNGVELLLVSPQTVFAVVTIEVGRHRVE